MPIHRNQYSTVEWIMYSFVSISVPVLTTVHQLRYSLIGRFKTNLHNKKLEDWEYWPIYRYTRPSLIFYYPGRIYLMPVYSNFTNFHYHGQIHHAPRYIRPSLIFSLPGRIYHTRYTMYRHIRPALISITTVEYTIYR